MKHKVLSILFAAAFALLLSAVGSVFAQTTEVCQRVTYPYGTYTQWSVTGQGCSSVGSTRDVPNSQPAPQPTAAPTQIPVYQPTSVPSSQSIGITLVPVGGEVLGGACSVPFAYSSDRSLICSVDCGNIWRSAAGGCPSGVTAVVPQGQEVNEAIDTLNVTNAEQAVLTLSYACGGSNKAFPYLSGVVWDKVKYFVLTATHSSGTVYVKESAVFLDDVFLPINYYSLYLKVVFKDNSFREASVIDWTCDSSPTPTPQPVPQTNLPTCTWTPYGYYPDPCRLD